MSEASHLAEAVEGLFARRDCVWFVTFPSAVEGLTASQAAHCPGPRLNSVWGIVRHLSLALEHTLILLRGEPYDLNAWIADGAWPPVPQAADEEAWQEAKADLLALNHEVAQCVARLDDAQLHQIVFAPMGMKAYQFIQVQIAHNSNHLNEMVTIRHMQGLWVDKT